MMHGLNTYDYGARQYNSVIPAWDRMDPLCEKYYSVSPYAYCGNNPVNRIDLDGREWYQDSRGMVLWNPKVHSNSDFSKRDIERGYKYIGKTFKKDGASYRADGSILYNDPQAAYNHIWSMSFYWSRPKEESAYILKSGKVLVMSDNWNDISTSKHVGYSVSGNTIKRRNGESYEIIAQVHTHPNKHADRGLSISYEGYSDRKFARTIPGIPVFVLQNDGYLYGGYYDKKQEGVNTFGNSPIGTVQNVLLGRTSLHLTAKEIMRIFGL